MLRTVSANLSGQVGRGVVSTAPARAKPPLHLAFLDGLRGLSALYVALYHTLLFTGYGPEREAYSPAFRLLGGLLALGPYAVAVFIVLSGFCLTLPVARDPARTLRGGFRGYLTRRARRILPPYYAALGLFLALIALVPVLQTPAGTAWDSKIPVSLEGVVSHLLLVHNVHPGWMFEIDGPMWSVATEWQLYFLFPLLLVLWRRFGLGVSVGFALVTSLAPQVLLPSQLSFRWLHPWFFGLFALGMAGAVVAFSPAPFWAGVRARLPWRGLAVWSALVAVALAASSEFALGLPTYLTETVLGSAVAAGLVHYTLLETRPGPRPATPSPLRRLLNAPVVALLGVFSYSVYLLHSPLLGLFNLLTLSLPLSADLRLLLMLGVGLPLAVFASYLFYRVAERPFTAAGRSPARAAATNRAPSGARPLPAPR